MAVGKGSILRAAGANAQSKAESGNTVHFIAAPDAQTEKLIKEKTGREDNKKENGGSDMAEEKDVLVDGAAEETVKAAEEKVVRDTAGEQAKDTPAEEKKAAVPKKTVGRPAGKKTTAKTAVSKAAASKAAAPKKTVKPAVKKTTGRKTAAAKAAEAKPEEVKSVKPEAEKKPEKKPETIQEPAVNQGRERHPVNKELPVYLL